MLKSVWRPGKKQQKTAKNSKTMFFCFKLPEIWVRIIFFPQYRDFMSEITVSTNILLLYDIKCVESYKNSKKQQISDKNNVFLP